MTSTTPVAELTYEQARDELVTIVGQLEAGSESLADAMSLWERGEALAKHCEAFLDAARERLKSAEAGETADNSAPEGSAQ